MHRSIAEGRWPLARGADRGAGGAPVAVGGALVILFMLGFLLTRPTEQVVYNHFAWQADAFLHGRSTIDFPVEATPTSGGNAYFNDVEEVLGPSGEPTGQGRLPFPPLPAIVLLPFVAVWGLALDQGFISVVIGALDVGIAFWLLGRLSLRPWLRILLTVFCGAGTALWYATSLGTTWYFAHVVAVGLTLAAVAVALDADAAQRGRGVADRGPWLDWRQVLAGFLLGLAATSRLTVAFGAVFLVLVGGGGTWVRRAVAAGIGVAVPILALVVYNQVTTGSPFSPVYQHLYDYEAWAYPDLGYNAAWAMQDLRYIPQNLGIMLTGLPALMPACAEGVARTLVNPDGCSWVVPQATGMSFLLASPAYLLAAWCAPFLRDRRVLGALAASLLVAVVNLMHFSQGWVQFGYRFSLDFAPFLLVGVGLGAERLAGRAAGRRLVVTLAVASVAIQAWGIAWSRTLQW